MRRAAGVRPPPIDASAWLAAAIATVLALLALLAALDRTVSHKVEQPPADTAAAPE
jgi:hypothetical protein